MSKLFIDATQLIEWPGKLTGVPRVMDELSRRFAKEATAEFVAWNRLAHILRPIQIEALDREQHEATESRKAPQGGLKHFVKRVEVHSNLARKALHYPRRLVHAARHKHRFTEEVGPALQQGDTLLILWGDWADQHYIEYIQRLQHDGIHIVQIVYDMLPLVTPQFSGHSTDSLDQYARAIYPVSSLLLSISHHTANDIDLWLKAQKLPVPPIEVIRLGDDFHTAKPVKPTSETFQKAKFKKQAYILCVGTFEARKNHALLYYAYKLAAQRRVSLPKLAIVGRRGWRTDDLYELITQDPDTKDQLILLENIDDNELAWLYKNCLFTIYPSFYEGWGLPIAESIAYGVPCICSNTSSMPEIAGELLTYFSPSSTDECLEAIRAMLHEKDRRQATQRIRKYKPTSWDQTYHQIKQHVKVGA